MSKVYHDVSGQHSATWMWRLSDSVWSTGTRNTVSAPVWADSCRNKGVFINSVMIISTIENK